MSDTTPNRFAEYGQRLVALGTALQDPDANFRDLTDLATKAGIQLKFRVERDHLERPLWHDGVLNCLVGPLSREHDVPWRKATYRMALKSGRRWCLSQRAVGRARIRPLDEWFEKHGITEWMES